MGELRERLKLNFKCKCARARRSAHIERGAKINQNSKRAMSRRANFVTTIASLALFLLALIALISDAAESSSSNSSGSSGSSAKSASSSTATQSRQSPISVAASMVGALGSLVPGLITNVAPLVLLFGIGALMMPSLGLSAMGLLRESRRR